MIKLGDDIRKKLVDDNKALTLEVEILKEALDNSENNVKRVSLLMSELKLSKAI
jgi:regulator of replication initiation timing